MRTSTYLSRMVTLSAAAAMALWLADPATAASIDWASWSGVSAGETGGSGTASFAADVITATYSGEVQSFVADYPTYTPTSSYVGGTVSNAPPQSNGIIQIYGGPGSGTDSITFSQAVLNPIIAIWSLGQGAINASFNFNESATIEAAGPSAEYGGSALTEVGNTVYGSEGNGVVQLNGTFTSISWTNPTAEDWYGFTVGITGPAVAAVPEPSSVAMLLAGLGSMALMLRRRSGSR